MSATQTTTRKPTSQRGVKAVAQEPAEPAETEEPADDAAEQPAEEPTEDERVPDLSEILPNPEAMEIAGMPVVVRRIRMRELMLLVQAVTSGIGSDMRHFNLDPKAPDFDSQLVGMLLMAVPRAVDDFVDLFSRIVEPRNPRQTDKLRTELENPEIEDAIDIAAIVIRQEKDDLVRLWGKLQVLIGAAGALYRTGKKGS